MKRIAAHYIVDSNKRILKKHMIVLNVSLCVENILPLNHETPSTQFYNGIIFSLQNTPKDSIEDIIQWQTNNSGKTIYDYLSNMGAQPIKIGTHLSELYVLLDIDFVSSIVTAHSSIRKVVS